MRISSRIAPSAVVSLSLLLAACGEKPSEPVRADTTIPKTGTATVKPHEDVPRAHLYCTYEITVAPKGASMKVGDFICIHCPADKTACDDYTNVKDSDDLVYEVKAKLKGLPCDKCPTGKDTPPGWVRELK